MTLNDATPNGATPNENLAAVHTNEGGPGKGTPVTSGVATDIRTYPEGVTSWIDLEVADVDATQAFYGSLFGWTFENATPPGIPFRYTIAQLDGKDVAGIGGPATASTAPPPRPTWNTYVAVDDIEAAVERVKKAGGAVHEAPTPAGEGGISAVLTDSLGIEFGLWQAKRRRGAQLTNIPGTWNFSDLQTPDTAASIEFYATVFGWEIDDLGFARMIRRPGYGKHLAATTDPDIFERQSGPEVPAGFADAIGWLVGAEPDAAPHWHVAFTVADRDATAGAARALGGTVLATTDTDWTRDAVIRDPFGATFTASQYAPGGAA